MKQQPNIMRILIVEDDDNRMALFSAWMPSDIRIVWAKSAGSAIGLIKRDAGKVYAGILLDHDLYLHATSEADSLLTGRHIAQTIIECISTDVPILVHSVNTKYAPVMVEKLEMAGFWVERIPLSELDQQAFVSWIAEVRENWED